jgi:hypothetical protein
MPTLALGYKSTVIPVTILAGIVFISFSLMVGLSLHSRMCQVGYVDHPGSHQLVCFVTNANIIT